MERDAVVHNGAQFVYRPVVSMCVFYWKPMHTCVLAGIQRREIFAIVIYTRIAVCRRAAAFITATKLHFIACQQHVFQMYALLCFKGI